MREEKGSFRSAHAVFNGSIDASSLARPVTGHLYMYIYTYASRLLFTCTRIRSGQRHESTPPHASALTLSPLSLSLFLLYFASAGVGNCSEHFAEVYLSALSRFIGHQKRERERERERASATFLYPSALASSRVRGLRKLSGGLMFTGSLQKTSLPVGSDQLPRSRASRQIDGGASSLCRYRRPRNGTAISPRAIVIVVVVSWQRQEGLNKHHRELVKSLLSLRAVLLLPPLHSVH